MAAARRSRTEEEIRMLMNSSDGIYDRLGSELEVLRAKFGRIRAPAGLQIAARRHADVLYVRSKQK